MPDTTDSYVRSELFSNLDDLKAIGRYKIISKLGQGAFGIVFLGRDPYIKRNVAVKISQPTTDNARKRFFKEAQSAGRLNHPNMVAIHDMGIQDKFCYITMEYLEGEDLKKFTRKRNLLPVPKIIDCMIHITSALAYAHRKGIVHRDIKPANIMLLKNGNIKITDFGTAKIVDTSHTQFGVVLGTPYYMSPEQSAGEKVDGRSDIFSLGVMLFQLLTGALPFHGANPYLLRNQIINFPHPDPRKYNPDIIDPLVAAIDKCLEKDPSERYQTASEMTDDFKEIKKEIECVISPDDQLVDKKPTPAASITVIKSRSLKLGKTFEFSGTTTIGRNSSNDIQILDHKVSRKHGELYLENDKYHIRDLGSKNRIRVDGKVIPEGGGICLHDGAQIGLSSETILEFHSTDKKN